MQKIILVLGIMMMSYCSFSGNPPEAVQKAFNQQFAKATDLKWGKENANEWEAEFKLNGILMSANYATDGSWLETETEITPDQLPANVKGFITKTYAGWQIAGASKIETSNKGILYEADIKSGVKRKEVSVTSEGKPTK